MKKIIFSIILIIVFLTVFISCINKNNPSNSNIDKKNDINISKEDTFDLNSDKKDIIDNSNNSNKEDIGSNNENNAINSTGNFEEDVFLSNIPYDRSIEYTTNINGNLINRANVAADENYIYYINIKDENKLYRISKDGRDNKLIYEERVEELQCINGKLYFLKPVEVEKHPTGFPLYDKYICSIDSEGNNYEEITYDREMKKFLILNDKVYYIAYSGLGPEELRLQDGQYDLFCYDIKSKQKSTVYEFMRIAENWLVNSSLISNDDNIYFETWYDGIVEYNIKTNTSRTILDEYSSKDFTKGIGTYILSNNKLIFTHFDSGESPNTKRGISISDIKKTNDETLCIFSDDREDGGISYINFNENYIFMMYVQYDFISEKKKVIIVRMKHDGSEAVKLEEIPIEYIYQRSTAQIYLIDDKLIFFEKIFRESEKMIKVMDFDGNEFEWDI